MEAVEGFDYIYMGSPYPISLKNGLLEKHAFVDFPADVLQHAILQGFCENGYQVRVLTSVRISGYSGFFIKPFHYSHFNSEKKDDLYVGAINFPIVNRLYTAFQLAKHLKKIVSREGKKKVMIYAVDSFSLFAVWLNRKRLSSVTLIVPDLPEFMSENDGLFYKIGKSIERRIVNALIHVVDKFVLLSPFMVEKLPIGNKPWIQMEGIFSETGVEIKTVERKKIILYTGNLDKRYGILDLLNAFRRTRLPEYELYICGNGDTVEEIKSCAKNDCRVKYLGILAHDEVLTLQRNASLLVNPRHKAETYTKYSFPSKTIEYMASGTPVLMSHLDSIPKEYEPYLFFFDDESVEGMSHRIQEICELPEEELNMLGASASAFIRTFKNPSAQVYRIINM